ncbi:vestigial like 4 like [Conger conger]|uniref:vestigial like 4 like n=1 Tax=Conger conger TaxID=82655 RepID=UPI002A59BFD1|nr:vestigial like 4 like [Conger conger]
MAVTNFHYITRMSSGFKVYILEGQPNMRTEDRYRHMTNEKARISSVYPMKRKHSPDRLMVTGDRCGRPRRLPLALTATPYRRQRAARSLACSIQRLSSLSPTQSPDSPTTPSSAATTSSWSPNPSPDRPMSPTLSPMYCTPPMDQPLALIKKPRRDQDGPDAKAQNTACSPIQVRPSVITRISSMASPSQLPCTHPAPMVSPAAYDHVVEEHFRRSLGVNYHKASSCQLSVSVSVDDHFAKALGEKWFQLKASTSPCSSSPSPTATVPGFRLSSQSPDDITTIPGRPFTSWSDKGQANTKK